jgi:hypothetical protein
MNTEARRYFLLGIRIFFGIWLLYVGLVKWFSFGAGVFVDHIVSDFDKTWSPHALNTALAWLILFAEPCGAGWILSGKYPRAAWSCVSLLMFLLCVGQTILMKDSASNWQFTVLTLVCAALSGPDSSRAS